MNCPHGHQVMICGFCLAKKFWPKAHKACPCGRLIPKADWRCMKCESILLEYWQDGGPAQAKGRFHVLRQLNA